MRVSLIWLGDYVWSWHELTVSAKHARTFTGLFLVCKSTLGCILSYFSFYFTAVLDQTSDVTDRLPRTMRWFIYVDELHSLRQNYASIGCILAEVHFWPRKVAMPWMYLAPPLSKSQDWYNTYIIYIYVYNILYVIFTVRIYILCVCVSICIYLATSRLRVV